ncbi:hypothetical protein ABBQ32_006863 [Trebouxia sp. C0010 RCD-2024]
MDTKGDSQTEYRSMLTSQDTGDHKQAPLPDLPVRSSHTSSNQGTDKPVTFTRTTVNRSPLAKDLAQAAKAGQPVAWVAHKDGRLDDIDSQPKLAEALPAKVSEKLTTPKTKKESGFFSKVLHGAVHVAKFAVLAGLTAVATDKIHKEYVTRKGTRGHGTHGQGTQDGPVKPLSDRGLLGRKV